jgi:Fe2+ or Zn2+ uptake regulation protein
MDNLLDIASSRLHAHGGRMTPQRRMILLALDSFNDHPTAEEIYHQLHKHDPTLHLSTIYRTLRWLEQEGLVQGCPFNAERHTERFDPSTPGDHHHFICKFCGVVFEFDLPSINTIKKEYEQTSLATVETVQLLLYGICHNCQG